MTYFNASPLMVHGKDQQGLRRLRLSVSGLVVEEAVVLNLAGLVVEEGAVVPAPRCHSLLKAWAKR
jgi:hypothetical protein